MVAIGSMLAPGPSPGGVARLGARAASSGRSIASIGRVTGCPPSKSLSLTKLVPQPRRPDGMFCRAVAEAEAPPGAGDAGGAAAPVAAPAGSKNEGKRGTAIRVEGLNKTFKTDKGDFVAVDDITLEIKPNSLVALLGPSGSGKTTLMRLISGLEMPSNGKIILDDVDMTYSEIRDREVGFVFQNYALFRHMTVADNIAFGPLTMKLDVDVPGRVQELLDLIQLPELGSRFPPQLSGGQRQRIALARALAPYPRLLLLDEPFGALDALVRQDLREWIKDLVSKVNVTTVIVTHDQEEAFEVATDVVIFNRGKIEQLGTPKEIFMNPKTPFVMNFLGNVNKIPADHQIVKNAGFSTKKPMVLAREMDIEVHKSPPEGKPYTRCKVSERLHLGWEVHYEFSADDGL
mmetsp:Transcript_47565/g.152417  ORF Transcript_47565/g.152417 Transcript_47565/m.152417 type:complete len:404 (-) Transcript_47565:440-1651(-)